MGVPFDESFLLRGQSLSHLGLTRAGLALCVDKTGGPGLLSWRCSHLESVLLLQAKAKSHDRLRCHLPLAPAQQEGRNRVGTRKGTYEQENAESRGPLKLTSCSY